MFSPKSGSAVPKSKILTVLTLLVVITILTLTAATANAASKAPGTTASVGMPDQGVYIPCDFTDMDLYDAFATPSATKVCINGSYGETFYLTVGGGKISGTGTGSTGCKITVTGSYSGTSYKMKMDQTKSDYCCDYWTVSGTINKTTKTATGLWVNSSDCGGSGYMTFSMCK